MSKHATQVDRFCVNYRDEELIVYKNYTEPDPYILKDGEESEVYFCDFRGLTFYILFLKKYIRIADKNFTQENYQDFILKD